MVWSMIKAWWRDESGLAAAEAAMIFPILLTLLLGTFDLGNAILANQKSIRASQIVADLVTRRSTVDDVDVNEAIEAGRLALHPFDVEGFGVDVISIRFDDEAAAEIVWRETQNMSPYSNALSDVAALAEANSGVVMVVVNYRYKPAFGDFVTGDIEMAERAFTRGRRSAVVCRDGVIGCGA